MVYTTNDLTQETYTPGQVAKYYNVTTRTIQKWDNTGKLPFHRTPTNRRIITREELTQALQKDGLYINTTPTTRKDAIYTRVSTQGQVNQGDLDRQALEILEQNQDLQNPIIIKDTASGLNNKRRGLTKLLQMVINDEINRIYITYKDRLTRFGYDYIQLLCESHGVKIIVQHENEDKSPLQELEQDFMSLIASFSGRYHGLRSHSNTTSRKK